MAKPNQAPAKLARKPRTPDTRPVENGVRQPRPESVQGFLWEKYDELMESLEKVPNRNQVIDAIYGNYANEHTGDPLPLNWITAQYSHWRKFHGYARVSNRTFKGTGGKFSRPIPVDALSGDAAAHYQTFLSDDGEEE